MKVAIITGANAGVGFGLVQHLLQKDESMTIVMACRNLSRANHARGLLLEEFPQANIDVEIVDVGNIASVFQFCENIKKKYQQINYLFCNAGILSALGINWKLTISMLLTDPVGLIERADATIQAVGEINDDGMGRVFAANVFGHYAMMRSFEPLLSNSKDGRVVWTSSLTADGSCFDINDWQGIKSLTPYESSKWACDLISVACHDRFQKENLPISSFTTSPGVVASNIGDLPYWVTELRKLLHYLMRFVGVTSQNISGYRGAVADAFVALTPLSSLNTTLRYLAATDRWGTSFVEEHPLDIDISTAKELIRKCELAYQAHRHKLP
ncbi:hypothetical protein [Absidia glauca]|uniref:3beta-hydroxysteroid 3-dehydrogenase n=1 Tax=Absidia glauca TaxID=4829 RepID=A0A168TB61_ABSGL|nr:hypothetical protein [Absidia glauca]